MVASPRRAEFLYIGLQKLTRDMERTRRGNRRDVSDLFIFTHLPPIFFSDDLFELKYICGLTSTDEPLAKVLRRMYKQTMCFVL